MRPISPKTLLYRLSCSSSVSPPPFTLELSHFSTTSSYSQHFHTHSSSLRRHDGDVRSVRISVWWDFENCNLPAGVNVFKVAKFITVAIRANGIKGPIQITAFGDMLQLSRANQEALSSTGINLNHVPHGGKNSADRSLLVDLMYWVSQNPPPAHLFLISGDRDFASILHRLRMNNYNILLASPENAPGVLCSAASIMWPWHALLTGENLNGKYFNQPPDGPCGTWYGHYKVPLEDPYSTIEQPALTQTDKLSEPSSDSKLRMIPAGSDSKPRPIPNAVLQQICKILKSHPKGISISDFRKELGNCNPSIDRNFYGHKKFTLFLLSIPHILKLQPLGEGKYIIHNSSRKSSEPCERNLGTGPVSDNGGQVLSFASELDGEDRSMDVSVNRKLSLSTSHEAKAEEPYLELKQPFSPNSSSTRASDGTWPLPSSLENVKSSAKPQQISPIDEKSLCPPSPDNVKTSMPIDKEFAEVAKAQDTELHFPPGVAQDSASELGYFSRTWRILFGCRHNVSGVRSHNGEKFCNCDDGIEREDHDIPVKQSTSVDTSGEGEGKDKEMFVASISQVVDQASPASSSSHNESVKDNKTATSYEVGSDKSKTGPGIFDQMVNWCKFWRSSPCSNKLSDQSYDTMNLMNPHSQEHKLFSTDSFWSNMESFMSTPKGSVLVSESRTREQMALSLQKEGPLFLRSLLKGDLLHLVDLLISVKKWVEECPFQASPFKLSHRDGKSSLNHSNGSKRLRSIFADKPSRCDMQRSPRHDEEEKYRNIPHSGVSLPVIEKKPSNRSRSEIIADCLKLVNEILKEYPKGYNMGLFRKLFLDRYGYHLDLHMLGYEKLATLLLTMPGVKIESSYIIPLCKAPKTFDIETLVPSSQNHTVNPKVANSDGELSDAPSKVDGGDSPWEELGPVANKNKVEVASRRKAIGSGFDYEASLSDEFSDSEGETSPITDAERQSAARVNKEDSSLLQMLDSWYSNKDGKSSKEKLENVDGMVDSPSVSKLSGSSGVGIMSVTSLGNQSRKQRPQKSCSFVADSGDNKDKLIDGILGSLKKSSEPRMGS